MMSFDDLRVVGFEGDFEDACGYTFPIVRHIRTNQYFDLSIDETSEVEGTTSLRESQTFSSREKAIPEPDYIYSEREINSLFEAGRLIRLPEEVDAFNKLDAPHDVVVVYVTRRFLDAIERPDPSSVIREHNLAWQSLPDEEQELWVTCASEGVVVGAFDDWANFLMRKCRRRLVEFFSQGHQDIFQPEAELAFHEIGELCDVALTAAQDNKDLKSRIYLLYGVTYLPSEEIDPLGNLYISCVQPEFTPKGGKPLWDRETFYEQVYALADGLRIRAALKKPLSSLAANSWLNFTDAAEAYPKSIDDLVKEVKRNIRVVEEEQRAEMRLIRAQMIAEQWRHDYPASPEVIEGFLREIENSLALPSASGYRIDLDYEFINALAGEPAFYLHRFNAKYLDEKYINHATFRQKIEDLSEAGVKHGPLAKKMMTPKAIPVGA